MAASGEEMAAALPGRNRQVVTVALMLAMTVAALEQTVVSTAMPSIIASLKGLETYPWVLSAYLLASTVATPMYGKLADLLGRKRVLIFGLGLFSLGSMLSGLARSMPELIGMRALQGLGAGAVTPIVITMLGDMYTLKERAKVQALFSGIWGVSSIAGPTLGGYLTDQLSWRWVFFVTVPFGVVSAWILVVKVREPIDRTHAPPIDWAGAGLLAASSSALLLSVLGGRGMPWEASAGLFASSAVLAVLFVRRQGVAADPILPLGLLARREIGWAIVGCFLLGAVMFGLDMFVPLYVQGVRGGSATDGGRSIMPLFLAWAISVTVAAKVVVRFGFRLTASIGAALIALGMLTIAVGSRRPEWSVLAFAPGMALIGLGMGPTMLSFTLGVQNAVDWGQRGVATGALTFFRTLGSALGVALLGKLVGIGLARGLAERGIRGVDVSSALTPEGHKLLSHVQLAAVRTALEVPLSGVFFLMVGIAGATLLCALRLEGGRPVSRGDRTETPVEDDQLALLAAEGA